MATPSPFQPWACSRESARRSEPVKTASTLAGYCQSVRVGAGVPLHVVTSAGGAPCSGATDMSQPATESGHQITSWSRHRSIIMSCAIRPCNSPRTACGITCDWSISRCANRGTHGQWRTESAKSSANSVEWRQRPRPRRSASFGSPRAAEALFLARGAVATRADSTAPEWARLASRWSIRGIQLVAGPPDHRGVGKRVQYTLERGAHATGLIDAESFYRVPELDAVLISRREFAGRRHFDLAHELFHILTWDAMPPEHSETARETGGNRVEQLANTFAAGAG